MIFENLGYYKNLADFICIKSSFNDVLHDNTFQNYVKFLLEEISHIRSYRNLYLTSENGSVRVGFHFY